MKPSPKRTSASGWSSCVDYEAQIRAELRAWQNATHVVVLIMATMDYIERIETPNIVLEALLRDLEILGLPSSHAPARPETDDKKMIYSNRIWSDGVNTSAAIPLLPPETKEKVLSLCNADRARAPYAPVYFQGLGGMGGNPSLAKPKSSGSTWMRGQEKRVNKYGWGWGTNPVLCIGTKWLGRCSLY